MPTRSLLIATLLALGATGCASRRVLELENRVLLQENASLQDRVHTLQQRMPPPGSWVAEPTLEDLHRLLDEASHRHTWTPGSSFLRMDFVGKHRDFAVTFQVFEAAHVVYLATDDYLHLEAASNPESLVLLLVQLVALNYEMLVGKFQLNTETGEVLLSVELPTQDGLGRDTFLGALEQLLHTADARYPELQKAAAGLGL